MGNETDTQIPAEKPRETGQPAPKEVSAKTSSPAEAARKEAVDATQGKLKSVDAKTQPTILENIDKRMQEVGAAAGAGLNTVAGSVSSAAGAAGGFLGMDRFIKMFDGVLSKLDKIDYWINQGSYMLAPLVAQLKSFKIPGMPLGFEGAITWIEQIVGLNRLMLSTSLKKAGLQPAFNSQDPKKDSAVFDKMGRLANRATKKDPELKAQEFFDDVAAKLAEKTTTRVVISLEELVPVAEAMVEGMTQESPKKTTTPTTSSGTQSETPAEEEIPQEIPKTLESAPQENPENPVQLPAPVNLSDTTQNFIFNGKEYLISTTGKNPIISINGKTWKIEGVRGTAKGATIALEKLEWDGKELHLKIHGDNTFLFVPVSKDIDSKLNANMVESLLKHMSTSTSEWKLKDEKGEDTGADLVPVLT